MKYIPWSFSMIVIVCLSSVAAAGKEFHNKSFNSSRSAETLQDKTDVISIENQTGLLWYRKDYGGRSSIGNSGSEDIPKSRNGVFIQASKRKTNTYQKPTTHMNKRNQTTLNAKMKYLKNKSLTQKEGNTSGNKLKRIQKSSRKKNRLGISLTKTIKDIGDENTTHLIQNVVNKVKYSKRNWGKSSKSKRMLIKISSKADRGVISKAERDRMNHNKGAIQIKAGNQDTKYLSLPEYKEKKTLNSSSPKTNWHIRNSQKPSKRWKNSKQYDAKSIIQRNNNNRHNKGILHTIEHNTQYKIKRLDTHYQLNNLQNGKPENQHKSNVFQIIINRSILPAKDMKKDLETKKIFFKNKEKEAFSETNLSQITTKIISGTNSRHKTHSHSNKSWEDGTSKDNLYHSQCIVEECLKNVADDINKSKRISLTNSEFKIRNFKKEKKNLKENKEINKSRNNQSEHFSNNLISSNNSEFNFFINPGESSFTKWKDTNSKKYILFRHSGRKTIKNESFGGKNLAQKRNFKEVHLFASNDKDKSSVKSYLKLHSKISLNSNPHQYKYVKNFTAFWNLSSNKINNNEQTKHQLPSTGSKIKENVYNETVAISNNNQSSKTLGGKENNFQISHMETIQNHTKLTYLKSNSSVAKQLNGRNRSEEFSTKHSNHTTEQYASTRTIPIITHKNTYHDLKSISSQVINSEPNGKKLKEEYKSQYFPKHPTADVSNNYDQQQHIRYLVHSDESNKKFDGKSSDAIIQGTELPGWFGSSMDVMNVWIHCSGINLTQQISNEEDERYLDYYYPPGELSFDEMAYADDNLSPIAMIARAIKWILLGWFFLGILFMSIIFLAFAKVKDTHSYLYFKEKIAKNETFKNLVSAFDNSPPDRPDTPELQLKSPSSSCSSLLSLSSVVRDNLRETPIYDWESIETFLLDREKK